MKVNFFATLRQITGTKTVEFAIQEGATVRELLAEIVRQYPPIGRELLDDQGELYRHVHIMLNGRDVPYLEKTMETVLHADDKVDIFPAVGGGLGGDFELSLRGIPLWLIQEYLAELGGKVIAHGLVQGEGWTARLAQLEDYQIGALRVGQVNLSVSGEAAGNIRPEIEKKLVRAGG